jgi:hypothetical protein
MSTPKQGLIPANDLGVGELILLEAERLMDQLRRIDARGRYSGTEFFKNLGQ